MITSEASSSSICLNRTILELKPKLCATKRTSSSSLNRSILGLKRGKGNKHSWQMFFRLIVGVVAGFYAVFAFWGLNAGGQVGDGMVFERLIAKSEHQMGFID